MDVDAPAHPSQFQIHISTLKMSSSLTLRAVIFHGNCCDGLGAAYMLAQSSTPDSQFFPVSPSDSRTWPDPASLVGHEIIFADVCFPAADMKRYQDVAKALGSSVLILDHHPLAASVVAEAGCAAASVTSTAHCATWLVHEHCYPGTPLPLWVQFLDGIDNWRDITDEHRALRELWHPIACKGVKESPQAAILEFGALLADMESEEGWASAIAEGLALYRKKVRVLSDQLDHAPRRFYRGLFPTWIGDVYVTNTGRQFIGATEFDTTAASELVFQAHKNVVVFLNYHEVRWLYKGVQHRKYVFHARARDGSGVDLTQCPILKGHAAAAGGQVTEEPGKPVLFVF
jgi:hypothetical protein